MRAITYTQFLRPNGRPRRVAIMRPDDIADAADAIVAAGGRLEIEELLTGAISMTVEHDDLDYALAHEVCANDPAVLVHVDKLLLAGAKVMREQVDPC